MIGLQFIAKEFHMSLQDIANLLGITRKSISNWTNGWQPIPKKHLGKLSQHFGIREEYFQKELTEAERLEIQIAKFTKEDIERKTNEDYQNATMVSMLSDLMEIEKLLHVVREEIDDNVESFEVMRKVVNVLQKKNNPKIEALLMFLLCLGDFMGGTPFTKFQNEQLGKEMFELLKVHGIISGEID